LSFPDENAGRLQRPENCCRDPHEGREQRAASVSRIHMRDAANVLKSAYAVSTGGGGGAGVTISPSAYDSTGTAITNSSFFGASFTGGTPTSIVWSVTTGGAVSSGQGTNTALIQVTSHGEPVSVTITCTAIIAGVSYSATATKTYTRFTGA
jgi:hypothetical protein